MFKKPYLTIAISSRALFELEKENLIYEKQGLDAYTAYQREFENQIMEPGTAFPLIKAILNLNCKRRRVGRAEVIIVSKNNADTSIRIFNSIKAHGLDITRCAFTSGEHSGKYLKAFDVDLFLSASEFTVKDAAEAGIPAGLIYSGPQNRTRPLDQIRVAFDGDAVLFSDESERIFQEQGLDAFIEHESKNAKTPMRAGPLAKLLKALSYLQHQDGHEDLIRTALVTARNSPAIERVIWTLREWNVRIDEAFFMGGQPKTEVLEAFDPHIYFDDQITHCERAASVVPTARIF